MGRQLVVEADGGSRGNPGVAGYGALVRDRRSGELLAERAEPLGRASNNVAEYSGLIAGLLAAESIDPAADLDVAMDSKLVVEQMAGRWKIKHEDMRRLALEARDVARRITAAGGSVTFRWVPREQNKDADALSNKAMDGESINRVLAGAAPPPTEIAAQEAPELAQDAVEPEARGVAAPHVAPTRVLLVRHGVTDYTADGRLDGRGGADPSLNTVGQAQAAAAGRTAAHLTSGQLAAVVTSSLARAVQTGAAVAEAVGVTPSIDPDWDEQSFGDWDGAAVGDLLERHPAELDRLRRDPAYRRPGGETHAQLAARVLPAFERVVATGGTTVVVCHRKPIMVVLAHLLAIPHERVWRLAAAPGSLTAIEVWPDGNVSVAFTNRT